jgi:hypothetical protein
VAKKRNDNNVHLSGNQLAKGAGRFPASMLGQTVDPIKDFSAQRQQRETATLG